MNRLKILQNLSLRAYYRVPYSNFEVNPPEVSKNIQIELTRKFREFRLVVSACGDDKNDNLTISQSTSTSATNFGSRSLKKITSFATSKIEKKYGGIFSQQNVVLSSLSPSFHYTNVRNFSDEASEKVITFPYTELSGLWKFAAESTPVEYTQNGLIWLHTTTGLPWWATIVLATCCFRTFVIFPLALHQLGVLAKVINLGPELNKIVEDLKLETNFAVYKYKWSEKYARNIFIRSLKKQRQKLYERDNCHPMKILILVAVQISMWMTFSTALRNLCYILPYHTESARTIYLELTTGGFGWMTDLTVPDGTFIIPVALGLLNLSIVKMYKLTRAEEMTRTNRILSNFSVAAALVMVPLAAYVPTGVSFYWVTSSAFGLAQNLISYSPSLRRLVGIPPTAREVEKPYTCMYNNLRRKIGLKDVISTENDKNIVNKKSTIKNS